MGREEEEKDEVRLEEEEGEEVLNFANNQRYY